MLNRLFRSLFVLSLFIGCASHPAAPVTSEIPDEYLALPTTDAEAGILPPRAIRRVEPLAPAELVDSGRTVEASVGAAINAEGRVEAVWLESGDPVWARALADAVSRWTFEPATKDGQPIAVRYSINSKFTSR